MEPPPLVGGARVESLQLKWQKAKCGSRCGELLELAPPRSLRHRTPIIATAGWRLRSFFASSFTARLAKFHPLRDTLPTWRSMACLRRSPPRPAFLAAVPLEHRSQLGSQHKEEPKWRNWQTRWIQNPVGAIQCGFESHLRYLVTRSPTIKKSGPQYHRLYCGPFLLRHRNRGRALASPETEPYFGTNRAGPQTIERRFVGFRPMDVSQAGASLARHVPAGQGREDRQSVGSRAFAKLRVIRGQKHAVLKTQSLSV